MSGAIKTAYVFLDIEHPCLAWNVYRGTLISPDQLLDAKQAAVTLMMAGIINTLNSVRLTNELIIEEVRMQRYSNKPSRLRSLYFFIDEQAANKAINWGNHFKLKNLVEVGIRHTENANRFDADWITHAPTNEHGLLDKKQLSWIDYYWSGNPKSTAPHWEYLLNGYAVIYGTLVRENAYKLLKNQFQKSMAILEFARLAAWFDLDFGYIVPIVMKKNENSFKLRWAINHNEELLQKLAVELSAYKGPVNFNDLQTNEFVLPDLRPYFIDFELQQHSYATNSWTIVEKIEPKT